MSDSSQQAQHQAPPPPRRAALPPRSSPPLRADSPLNPIYESIVLRGRHVTHEQSERRLAQAAIHPAQGVAQNYAGTTKQPAPPSLAVHKAIRKPALKAQFMAGLSYPGGALRLVQGTEEALTELEAASIQDGLNINQQVSTSKPTATFVTALMKSVHHLQVTGEFPVSFLPVTLDQPVRDDDNARRLQMLGTSPFTTLDISRVLTLLSVASTSLSGSSAPDIKYQLGIVTGTGSGLGTKLRAQLIPPTPTKNNAATLQRLRTIWLYRRAQETASGGYEETWLGFKKASQRRLSHHGLRHPVTGQSLEVTTEGYRMMTGEGSADVRLPTRGAVWSGYGRRG